MASPSARWWRVVVDQNGKVSSCKEAEAAGGGTASVHYVQASNAKRAAKLALNAHAARMLAARRARYKSEGLCKCGRKRDRLPFETCAACFARQQVHNERKEARGRGEKVAPLDRRTVLQERKAADANQLRLRVLVEVQRVWSKAPNNQAFSRWLKDQIAAINGKAVA